MGSFSLVRGRALRATRLNGCGAPVLGPDSVVATEGFISVALTSNTEAGEAISVTNAAGKVCVNDTPTPKFVNYGVEVQFCGVNPALITLMTGQPARLNAAGDAVVGFAVNDEVNVDDSGFALELWSGVPVEECDESGEATYGYMLLPFIKGGTLGDFTVENAAVNFSMTGAQSKRGSGWGVGPFDVVRDESNVAGPLNVAVTAGDHLIVEVTTVPPPAVDDDDPQALGVPATGAVAGIPGDPTPANSYFPKDLAELIAGAGGDHGVAVVANPATAWTAGQHIILRDGSLAHWTSAAWAAGAA
jgi:hypothetical protein